MKKISIILTSVLLLATIVASPTHALYREEDNTIWYTVEELFDYRVELDKEKRNVCGDDVWCQQEYHYNKIEEEPKALALEQLMQQQFMLTAANPGEEYIKVWFFGEDTMLSRMGIHEEIGIEMVYIGWLEDEPERIYYQGMDYDKYTSGEIDGLHTIYAWRNDSSEENLIRSNEEIVLDAKDLIGNTSGQLVYFVDSGEGKFNAIGRLIYTNCLSEADYGAGVECRLMTSAEKGQAYYPPRKTTMNKNNEMSDSTNEPAITDDTNILWNDKDGDALAMADDEASANVNDNDTNNVMLEIDTALEDVVDSNNDAQKTAEELGLKSTLFKAPNTGANTGPCNQKTIEFPWWMVVLIALGDAIILWLFWPNRKKYKKTSKNS